jgi:RHS repeat-associated protein
LPEVAPNTSPWHGAFETGLDYFGARYYSGGQGRFTTADGPFYDQDESDPQSWNLYSYVRNNPLVGTDPTGMFEEKPPDPWAPGGPLFQLWWDSLQNTAAHIQNTAQQTWNYITNPANWQYPSCVAGKTGTWGAAGTAGGAAVGAVGVAAGGVGEFVTVPTGALVGGGGGAIAGGVSGLITCSQGTGAGGVGGSGGGQNRSTAGNMQRQVERGQAPRSVDRVDRARFPFEKDQVHFKDGHALNYDGTWKHGGRALTNAESDWLLKNGWSLPK